MKILVVSPVFWPEDFRINDLGQELVRRGHEVEILAGWPNYPAGKIFDGYGWQGPWEEPWSGAKILRFPVRARGKGGSLELIIHYVTWLLGATARLLFLRKTDWDVIFVYQTTPVSAAIPALLARALSRAPAVIWVQDLWPEIVKASGLVTRTTVLRGIGWFSNLIYRSFDLALVQSRSFGESLKGRGIPGNKVECVYNWAEDLYQGEAIGESQGWTRAEGEFVVMFAGNLGRMQGLPTVLEAVKLLREVPGLKWVFLGDGALREWMEEEVEQAGLSGQVHLLGRRPLEEMPGFFRQADAMLLSLGRSEALALTVPGKLQSYLASGKPVLGSVDGEAASILEASGAGWAAAAEDPEALAALVRRLLAASAEERARLGLAGRDYYPSVLPEGGLSGGHRRFFGKAVNMREAVPGEGLSFRAGRGE